MPKNESVWTRQLLESFDSAPIGVFLIQTGKFKFANKQFQEYIGFSEEEMLEKDSLNFVFPEDRERTRENAIQMLKGFRSSPYEYRSKTKSCELRYVMGTIVPIQYEGQRAALGYYVDITERKQAEEKLRESEEKYRVIFNEARDGIVLIDCETGLIVDCNPEFESQTGRRLEQLKELNIWEVRPPEKIEAARQMFFDIKNKGAGSSLELELQKPNGDIVNIEFASRKIKIRDKQYLQSISRDISERKKMEEQLIITDRLASVGELAAGIAHELNNPLTGVIGFSDLLLQKDVTEDIREDLEVINREAKRTAEVVRNMLTFARKHEAENKPVNINTIIEYVLRIRAYEQRVNNIEVKTNLAPDLPEITADAFRLQQVFINIIINAEHFMSEAHEKGILSITTESDGNIVRTTFADDGPGIASKHLNRIFDPFFTTKKVGKGTGLGLSICHGIITAQGGRIYAESKPGEGTTFVIELPILTRGESNEKS